MVGARAFGHPVVSPSVFAAFVEYLQPAGP
jgi:hypothetical protein